MNAITLVSVQALDGASVPVGWFRRARLALYTYSDGSVIIGYPVVESPLIVQEVAKVYPRV